MKNKRSQSVFLAVFFLVALLVIGLFWISGGAAKYEKQPGEEEIKKLPPIVQAYAARTESPVDPGKALEMLQAGNKRYISMSRLQDPGVGEESRRFLAFGQWPYAVILTSSDSRIPPEYIFDAGLGDLVVIRVMGPVADTAVIASIENAMNDGNCRLLVVLGHKECRAIKNAIRAVEYPGTVESYCSDKVINKIIPAVLKAQKLQDGKPLDEAVARNNVEMTIQKIKSGSQNLRRLVDSGKISMVGAYVELPSGKVSFMAEAVPASK